jgi:ubiquinone/menaquinone biosynthesis C-methylase UbiE
MKIELVPQPCDSLEQAHDGVRKNSASYARRHSSRRKHRVGYLRELIRRYRFYVATGSRVLEIGVGTGDLLAALEPSRGVGVDISSEMLNIARTSHPELELYESAAEDLKAVHGEFDYIILSDLTVYVYDLLAVLRTIKRLCHARTRLIFNFHSRLWQPVLYGFAALGLHHRHYRTNWITAEDLNNMLELAGYQVICRDKSTLSSVAIPFFATIANRYLFRLPLVQHLCLVNWIVARPRMRLATEGSLGVSVICPCRNEAGNIESIVKRLPSMGRFTELIFVEGGSTDNTWQAVQTEVTCRDRPDLQLSGHRQSEKGKADAVRYGFSKAKGDVLMVLDADLSVSPEDLAACLTIVEEGKAEFINGSRLVYPMDEKAMRFMNLIGNKTFALCFSRVLGQQVKDTLCGTKVLTRYDYNRIVRNRGYFGDFDPFGDFELLFGAAKLNLKILEFPFRYRERTYGETNIRRFRDGWKLLRMLIFGFRRFKFI